MHISRWTTWVNLGLEGIRRELAISNSVVHALDMIWAKPFEQRVQIVTLWWLWWCNRNKLREGEKTLDAGTIAHQTRCSAAEYIECFGKQKEKKNAMQSKWLAPEQGVLKFNIDGAFNRDITIQARELSLGIIRARLWQHPRADVSTPLIRCMHN
jgi:hypothetical protein